MRASEARGNSVRPIGFAVGRIGGGAAAAAVCGLFAPVAAWGASPELAEVAARHFDPEFLARTRAYHDVRYALWFVQAGLLLALVWLLARRFRGAGGTRLLGRFSRFPWAGRLAAGFLAAGLAAAVSLPVSGIRFAMARAEGLRHDSWPAFLRDYALAAALDAALVAAVAALLFSLFARFSRAWWILSGGALAVLAPAYVFLLPLVVDPLFNRTTPLADGPLAESIRRVVERGGVPVRQVLVTDASRRTRAVNAYFTGFGPSRRIVLYDTLLESLDEREVMTVVAHEVGHWRHAHVASGLALGVLAGTCGLGLASPLLRRWSGPGGAYEGGTADPRLVFPGYALFVTVALAATPAVNVMSRAWEAEADRVAISLTDDPDAFIAGKVRSARENLSDVAPPPWIEAVLFTHPATARRILFAESSR